MINEHKKGVRAVKYTAKPRNPVGMGDTPGRGTVAHKDKKKVADQPRKAKHKAKEISMAEGLLKEDIMGAPRPEDNHEATMALSELYRNAKYGMALLKIIESNDAIDGWVQANLTSAADMLDKVGHYLDYKNIHGRKPEVAMEEDDNVDDADPGDTDGSMAREHLEMIVEYSIRLMEMIKPGDNLASWVSMKLTKASEAISSAKHFIEYRNFEKHAGDVFENKLTRMLASELSEAGHGRNRGYEQGFASPTAPSLGGGRKEIDEPDAVNNIEVSINGRPWKVFAGHGLDSSQEFFKQKQKVDELCKRKTAETGKKWSWGVTGAPATN
jgi:hypothetical protein